MLISSVLGRAGAVFLFLYFLFSFFTKIYFRVRNLHEYTPPAPLSGGRGLSAKKVDKKLRRGPWRTGRPAAGRPALAARLRGDRPPKPYIRCWLPLTPSFASLKIQKKRKENEGGRGKVRERQSGEALSDFQAGDFR